MFLNSNEKLPLDLLEECDAYITEFLSGRDLISATKPELERRKFHDIKYQQKIHNDEKRKFLNRGSKKYRQEKYNDLSRCDVQFINNYHTYYTSDGGSGYNAAENYYAADFVKEAYHEDDETTVALKKMKVSGKKEIIEKWFRDYHVKKYKKSIRRSFSCPDFLIEINREEVAYRRMYEVIYNAHISNIDVSFLPSTVPPMDTSRLLCEISFAMKHLISRVNTADLSKGHIRISKVIFSTEDLYAYVLPESEIVRKALIEFSSDFGKWFFSLNEERRKNIGKSKNKRSDYFYRKNVILILKEFEEDGTMFRRARHICRIPVIDDHIHLFLEIDTGMLRVLNTSNYDIVRMLPMAWALVATPILEVRFEGAKTEHDVARRIETIRKTGEAIIKSFDLVKRPENIYKWNGSDEKKWSTQGAAVCRSAIQFVDKFSQLLTRKNYSMPPITTFFCEDRNCRGLCHTEKYLEKPPRSVSNPSLEKLTELRNQFSSERILSYTKGKPLTAYLLPNTDSHQNERIPEFYRRLKFLNGFTGLGGCAVITQEKALLWCLHSYLKLAENEVNTSLWKLKDKNIEESVVEWLIRKLNSGDVVGFDPEILTMEEYKNATRKLIPRGIKMCAIPGNLVDNFWTTRPFLKGDVVKILSLDNCGKAPFAKLNEIRKHLKEQKCSGTVISTLDDIMWFLNIRGNDLPYNPLSYSYLFITYNEVHLFIHLEKLDKIAQAHLNRMNIKFHEYCQVQSFLSEWIGTKRKGTEFQCISLTPETNYMVGNVFEGNSIVESSFARKVKTIKNKHEISGMRAANLRDSLKIIEYLCWYENIKCRGKKFTEVEMVERMERLKECGERYIGLSFPTVFASQKNTGDYAHEPDPEHSITHSHQFLIQTGSHYEDGTTNCTRVVHDFHPDDEYIKNYTTVLKGHIRVASSRFPSMYAARIDVLARNSLWSLGLDYYHDTGYSVGHSLNTKETQVIIGDDRIPTEGRLSVGQTIVIEPGLYLEGKYGIQIGNMYEIVDDSTETENFYKFEALTLVPIQTSVINKNLLSPEEILWLNNYHHRVLFLSAPTLLSKSMEAEYQWLCKKCKPI